MIDAFAEKVSFRQHQINAGLSCWCIFNSDTETAADRSAKAPREYQNIMYGTRTTMYHAKRSMFVNVLKTLKTTHSRVWQRRAGGRQ